MLAGAPVHLLSDHCEGALMAMGQQPPPPGNPGHVEPPPGVFCYTNPPKGQEDHACACHRKCVITEDDNGNEEIQIQENVACRSWCFKSHCACPPEECP